MLRRTLLYTALTLCAVVTLVPFAYMICSAIKPKSVLFNAPFLPVDGLFEIDRSTGELRVVNVDLLPPADPGQNFNLELALSLEGEERSRRTLTVGYGKAADGADLTIPPSPAVNQVLGRVRRGEGESIELWKSRGSEPAAADATAPKPEVALAEESILLPRFEITGGNPHGTLGVAWGLLTADNFDRLFNGVPPEGNPDGEPIPTGVWRAIVNSFFYASVSSVLATLGAAMGGYALAKFRFRGRALIDNLVLAAIVIPGALLIAPGYQILYWLGLLDSYAGLILPGIAPAFGVFLFRQAFLTSLPDEMMEASRIDGCGEIRMFFTIALPMARPMIGAFLLINYLGAWNNFISPQIILQSPEKYPLAVWISQLRGLYGIDYGLIMAGTLVAIAPVLVLFLMLQKEFIAGLTAGAVKG